MTYEISQLVAPLWSCDLYNLRQASPRIELAQADWASVASSFITLPEIFLATY